MELKFRDVKRGLKRKGFKDLSGSKHIRMNLYVDDVQTSVTTFMQFSQKPLRDTLIKLLAEQCHLSKRNFVDLVECPMSRKDYIAHLRGLGVV